MNILHYTLGLPPFRSGGLTKYSVDLMLQQSEEHNVFLLYPGSFSLFKNNYIRDDNTYHGIKVYEIVNPLPVPLLSGINRYEDFMKSCDKNVYKEFLIKKNIEVIHIHTLMGLHKEFLIAAKELGIKSIYTTHDYFGLCLKANMLCDDEVCDIEKCKEKSFECSENAYSLKLIYLMQSKIYRKFKTTNIISKLRSYKKNSLSREKKHSSISKVTKEEVTLDAKKDIKYRCEKLLNYYYEMFNLIDYFHFNSSVSKEVYTKYLNCKGEVISITHSNIKDNRKILNFSNNNENLRITFLGPTEKYKGFNLLIDSLELLNVKNINSWILNVYGPTKQTEAANLDNVYINGPYNYEELEKIFLNTDVVVIPSIWKETFGFIGLEALSYGIPLIVTENVGFKDIITNNETGFIIKPDKNEIAESIEKLVLNRNALSSINQHICSKSFNYDISTHSEKIVDLYTKVSTME